MNLLKESNLKVEMVLVTPELAENYLKFNLKNRKVSNSQVYFLSNEMKSGRFIENGESIVFDKNGELKDGQHRLRAIVKTGLSYFIPIVRGVGLSSMATYDTGKNRSAHDILTLNNYQYPNQVSALIKAIDKYSIRKSHAINTGCSNRLAALTNQQVLSYCELNYDWILDLITKIGPIYQSSSPKVLTTTSLALIAYLIGGEKPKNEVFDFLKYLMGLRKEQGCAPSYLYAKLLNSKINKDPLNFFWILGMALKSWNFYSEGNPSLKSFRFDISKELPKVNKFFNN